MGILHGNKVYPGSLHLLVDEIPKVIYKKIGNYFYGEKDGFVSLYEHQKGTTDGFAGRTITLDIEGVGKKDFKGSLWDPFDLPDDIPKFFNVSITTDPEAMEIGHTFMAGKITWDLAISIFGDLGVNITLKKWL